MCLNSQYQPHFFPGSTINILAIFYGKMFFVTLRSRVAFSHFAGVCPCVQSPYFRSFLFLEFPLRGGANLNRKKGVCYRARHIVNFILGQFETSGVRNVRKRVMMTRSLFPPKRSLLAAVAFEAQLLGKQFLVGNMNCALS